MNRKLDIQFTSDAVIELSFATVKPGMESQLFEEYFPRALPIVNEIGGSSLGSFNVIESNSSLGSPKLSVLFEWPTMDHFNRLHTDQRFLDIRHLRDEAMSLFSNGHFFEVAKNTSLKIEENHTYALQVILDDALYVNDALLILHPTQKGSNTYPAKRVYLTTWDKSLDDELSKPNPHHHMKDIYKITFNFPETEGVSNEH